MLLNYLLKYENSQMILHVKVTVVWNLNISHMKMRILYMEFRVLTYEIRVSVISHCLCRS
jgi:hypothetical protein